MTGFVLIFFTRPQHGGEKVFGGGTFTKGTISEMKSPRRRLSSTTTLVKNIKAGFAFKSISFY